MNPLHDYFYRFPQDHLHVSGRCRVRIYKRGNGTHTVLLTELNSNSGESITSACERIATDLAATKELNPKTTRWIQHDPLRDGLPQAFDELQFAWSSNNTARDPQWQRLGDEQAEALTGDSLGALSRRLGELESQIEEETEYEGTEV
jgi:hypothetical protein